MPGRVLVVAYFFPPIGGAGVFRALKFVKYLPEYDWRPYVLTIADDPAWPHDSTLLNEVPSAVHVERVRPAWEFRQLVRFLQPLDRLRGGWRLLALLNWLRIPDDKISWIGPGYRRARKLIKAHHLDVIFTTSAPYSSHLMGYWLKRTTGLPWVADFRDEWADNPCDGLQPTRLHHEIAKRLQRLVVNGADHVTTVCQPIVEMLRKGATDHSKFATITNGFDAEDIRAARAQAVQRNAKVFRLVYTGIFYGPIGPKYFIKALELLLKQGEIPADHIRVSLIGQVAQPALSRPEWQQILECHPYMAHEDVLLEQQRSDCLLLFIPRERGGFAYGTKVFEYVASGKPILALVPPDGAAADLIRKSRTGFVIEPNDVPTIQSTVRMLFEQWKAGRLAIEPDEQVIQCHERRYLTGRLAEILDRVRLRPRRVNVSEEGSVRVVARS